MAQSGRAVSQVDRVQLFCDYLDSLPFIVPGALLDLGCRSGEFAYAAADTGWTVTAVDARDGGFPLTTHGRISFVRSDVRDLAREAIQSHDVVACLGLLYHLPFADQFTLLRKCGGRPLILDTHIAVDPDQTEHPLGPLVEIKRNGLTFTGRMYPEPDPDGHPKSAWGNDESFWPTRATLRSMVELADYRLTRVVDTAPDRLFILATPGSWAE